MQACLKNSYVSSGAELLMLRRLLYRCQLPQLDAACYMQFFPRFLMVVCAFVAAGVHLQNEWKDLSLALKEFWRSSATLLCLAALRLLCLGGQFMVTMAIGIRMCWRVGC
jgi:hypothetical protein